MNLKILNENKKKKKHSNFNFIAFQVSIFEHISDRRLHSSMLAFISLPIITSFRFVLTKWSRISGPLNLFVELIAM